MFSFENKNSAIIRNTSLVSSSGISKDYKCNTHTDDCRDEMKITTKKNNQPTTDFLFFCFCPYFNKLPMQSNWNAKFSTWEWLWLWKTLWKLLLTFFWLLHNHQRRRQEEKYFTKISIISNKILSTLI